MDFTESELIELLTAVADQRSYYKLAHEQITPQYTTQRKYYEGKRDANAKLYNKLQAMLLALETAEVL